MPGARMIASATPLCRAHARNRSSAAARRYAARHHRIRSTKRESRSKWSFARRRDVYDSLATQKMPMQITIKPSDHAFPCDADETVLQAAMRADLMIPYGCRNGACGTCKGKIIGGDVDYGAYQRSTLSEDDKRAGLALFCCGKPWTDLVIEVREVRRAGDIQIRRLPCRIESIDRPA